MKNKLFATLLATLSLTSALYAEDTILHTEIDGVEVNISIPEGVKVLRGALVNPADAKVGGGGAWTETFRLHDSAHIGIMIKNLSRGNRGKVVADSLKAALAEFAAKSGHPELETIPFCFAGMSKGGVWSADLAMSMPERTVAFANVCGWVVDPKKAEGKWNVPGLFLIGGKDDGFHMLNAIPTQYDPGRKTGALWMLALQWDFAHDYANATALVMPFFDAILSKRLPKQAANPTAPVKLNELRQEDGWLGDRTNWEGNFATIAAWADYKGDKTSAVWLPNRYVATLWRAMVSKNSPVGIDAASADGSLTLSPGPKRTLVVPAGTVLNLTATVKEGIAVKKIAFYDGDNLIGESVAAPWRVEWKKPPQGPRGIYAQWEAEDGTKGVSNPALIFVK